MLPTTTTINDDQIRSDTRRHQTHVRAPGARAAAARRRRRRGGGGALAAVVVVVVFFFFFFFFFFLMTQIAAPSSALGSVRQTAGGVDNCEVTAPKTFAEGDGPPDYNVVHAIRVANDGTVYVADRENRRLQMFTLDGKFVKQLVQKDTAFARDLAFRRTHSSNLSTSGREKASRC